VDAVAHGRGRESESPREVDLVLFEAGGRRFGAEAVRVRRIARCGSGRRCGRLLGGAGHRVLVVAHAGGESEVPIDRLEGFVRVPVESLRAVPAYARPLVPVSLQGFFVGAQGELLPLIDLEALVKEDAAP
jgi:chemotaxis signal transduction protein